MKDEELSRELNEMLMSNLSKRAKIVVEHIIKYGYITTEDLEKKYGYSHPPRAARDVRESGIPLETFKVKSSDGRYIAAYRFGDLSKIDMDKLGGRTVFSKRFKKQLYEMLHGRCAICLGEFHSRYLQIDHRIPYEIAGDVNILNRNPEDYMLLCSSCNRAKSWSCEHCPNWQTEKSVKICSKCYWAYPESYNHIALKEIRRLDVIWEGKEVEVYEKLRKTAVREDSLIPDYVKKIIKRHVKEK